MTTTKEQSSVAYRDQYDYALNVTGIPDFTKMKAKTVSISGKVLSETVFQRIADINVKPGEKIRVKAQVSDGEPLYVIYNPAIHAEEISQEKYQFRVRGVSKYSLKSRWLYSAIYQPTDELMLGALITEFADILQTMYDDEIAVSTQHLLQDIIINPLLEKEKPKLAKLFPNIEDLSYDVEEVLAKAKDKHELLTVEEQVIADILSVAHHEQDRIIQQVKEDVHMTLEEVFRMGYKLKASDKHIMEMYESEIKNTLLKSLYDIFEMKLADKPITVALYNAEYLSYYTETIEDLILNGQEWLTTDYNLLIVETAKGIIQTSHSLLLDFAQKDISVYQAQEKMIATYAATLEDAVIIHKYDRIAEQTLTRELQELLGLDIKENPIQYVLFDEYGTTMMELAYELLELLKHDEIYTDIRKTLLDLYVTGHKDSYVMTIQKLVDDLLSYQPSEELTLHASIGLIGSNQDKSNFDWLLYEEYQDKYRKPLTLDEVSIQTVEEYACLYKFVSQRIEENVTIIEGDSAALVPMILGSLIHEKARHFSPTEDQPLLLNDYVSYHQGYWESLLDEQVISYEDLMDQSKMKQWFSFYEYLIADIHEIPHRLIKALFYSSVVYTPQELMRMYFNVKLHHHYVEDIKDHALITTDTTDKGFPLGKFVLGGTALGEGSKK